MFDLLIRGFSDVMTLNNLLWIIIGTSGGIILGAIPGLTGSMGIALMIPLTFTIPPIPSICMLLGVYCGGTYGGSISAILINTPGSAASAVTVFDGYEMAKKGKAGIALKMALYASVVSGLISTFVLIFTSPILASMALKFGAPEYLALIILGLTVVAGISGENLYKGLIAGALGLFVASIGQDPLTGMSRLTFGVPELISGIDAVPLLIGLFAMSEILIQSEKIGKKHSKIELPRMIGSQHLSLKDFLKYGKTIIKGSLIGVYIGAIPGIGSSVASFVSYNEAIRSSKNPENYGKGELDGIAASESGNNGVTGATLIPLLTLGIPGDVVTGILMGAFMIQGLSPGPLLFIEHGQVIYAIFAGLIIVNLVMLVLGIFAIKFSPLLNYISGELMFSIVFVMCAVGAYATVSNGFMILIMIVFGIIGYILKKTGIPAGAFLIAYMLGNLFESNLQRTTILFDGKMYLIFTKPVAVVFLVLTVISIYYVFKMQKKRLFRKNMTKGSDA